MKNRPAIKVLIPYLAGIILADKFHVNIIFLLILSAFCLFAIFYAYKERWLSVSSVLIAVCLLFLAFLRYEISMTPPQNLDRVSSQLVKVYGMVKESQKERSGGSSLLIDGEAFLIKDPSISMKGKISIRSWEDNAFANEYGYGDIIQLEGKLTQPRPVRNPNSFDYRKYLHRQGVFATMTVNDVLEVKKNDEGGFFFFKWIRELRERVEYVISEISFDSDVEAIMKGIVLGENGEMSPELYNAFRKTSTTHILVVSGINFAILAGWVYGFFDLLRKALSNKKLGNPILENKTLLYIPVFLIVILYACMAGMEFSVMRAFVFISLFIFATILNRGRDLFNILGISSLCILAISPGAFWDAGFQLTFAAVASITYLSPYWEKVLSKVKPKGLHQRAIHWGLEGITVSISAQLGAGLIIAYTFGTFSLSGIIVNPLVAPLVTLITPTGFISCLIGLMSIPLANVVGWIDNFLILVLKYIVFWFSEFRLSSIPVKGFSLMHVIIITSFVIFAVNLPMLLRKNRQTVLIYGLAVLTVFCWGMAMMYDGHVAKITYLDVGEGDSIYAETPDNYKVLIDGGSYREGYSLGERVVAPFLRREGVGNLDLMVSTHPDNDHTGGLTYILDNFHVKKVLTGSYGLTSPTYKEFLNRLNGTESSDAKPEVIHDNRDVKIEVLSDQYRVALKNEDLRMNNNSVVLKLTYKEASFLFTGDIQKEGERQLINSGRDVKATVLKVPHHGSGSSSSYDFIRAVQPSVAVISVGYRNFYKHPSPYVVARYDRSGIKIYRTDKQGAVTIITDGRYGWIKTMSNQ